MITYWFPTGIYHNSYPEHNTLKTYLLDKVLENVSHNSQTDSWLGNPKNSCGNWDPLTLTDSNIIKFKNWIEEEVKVFSKSYGSSEDYLIKQCWANIYNFGDFQETHYHPGWDFSAVYFLTAPEGSGSLIFENPLLPDMRPIRTSGTFDLNCQAAIYRPVEGQLVIFRSNLRHGVYPNKSKENRISLAINLISKQQ